MICIICRKDTDDFYDGKMGSYCRPCRIEISRKFYNNSKSSLVENMGGKCSRCGYNKCYNALELHHLDPSTKEYNWNQLRSKSQAEIEAEASKCILVCVNCHREIHYELNLSKSIDTYIKKSNKKVSMDKACIDCGDLFVARNKFHNRCSKCSIIKNRKVKDRPDRDTLQELINNNSWVALGEKYGVSDNAVRKWARSYGIKRDVNVIISPRIEKSIYSLQSDGTKTCTCCLRKLLEMDFQKNSETEDKLTYKCRGCLSLDKKGKSKSNEGVM